MRDKSFYEISAIFEAESIKVYELLIRTIKQYLANRYKNAKKNWTDCE